MKAKRIAVYGILTAVGLIFSYVEGFISLSFIVPGVKLGLANGIALLLVYYKDYKGAIMVNFVRIFLSTLFFGNPTMLFFSVLGAAFSLLAMCISRLIGCSLFFISFIGAIFHNVGQLIACFVFFSSFSPIYYLPFLIIAGGLCGALTGIAGSLFVKNKNIVNLFKEF